MSQWVHLSYFAALVAVYITIYIIEMFNDIISETFDWNKVIESFMTVFEATFATSKKVIHSVIIILVDMINYIAYLNLGSF